MPETREQAPDAYRFSGFVSPRFTQIPDQLFDELLPLLSGNEVKTLLYICRRTFGFKKDGDNISLAQMVSGITTREGVKLDGGTGLSKASVARALKTLEEKRIILRVRRRDEKQGDLPTTYCLNMQESPSHHTRGEQGSHKSEIPRVSHRDTPLSHHETPRVSLRDTQETVKQETENTAAKRNETVTDRRAHVVAALLDHGMSQRVSERLVRDHSPDYIAEKIDFLDFKLRRETDSVKRPAAWLRKAIEDDYDAPNGFVSAAERERQANEEIARKRAASEAQKAYSAKAEEQQNARIAQQSQRLQRLFDRYQTSASDRAFWKRAEGRLAEMGISEAVTSSMQLVRLTEDQAVCHVMNAFMRQQIDHPRLKEPIEQVLSELANRPLHLKLILDDE